MNKKLLSTERLEEIREVAACEATPGNLTTVEALLAHIDALQKKLDALVAASVGAA